LELLRAAGAEGCQKAGRCRRAVLVTVSLRFSREGLQVSWVFIQKFCLPFVKTPAQYCA
jgi:hypothetical protein